MTFQTHVNQYQAPGVEGARASNNPAATVIAGPNGLQAGAAGVFAARFAWNVGDAANSYSLTGKVPNGFVANEQQGLITVWLDNSSMVIPTGLPVTEYEMGDFWCRAHYSDASVDEKVFANLFNGKILTAATGSFPVNVIGSSGTITASFATNVMTVTVTSVYLSPGMLVTETGVPAGTYIEAQLTGSAGGTGTYQLTTYPGTITSSATVVVTSPDGVGGATASEASISQGENTLTVTTLTNGTIAVGQLVSAVGIPAGTYISALGTGTGGTGTYSLSANATADLTTGACAFSSWIETPWYVKSPGNLGDLIKIGVKN